MYYYLSKKLVPRKCASDLLTQQTPNPDEAETQS